MSSAERPLLVAVDIGGTFSDVTLQDVATGESWTAKTPSTPHDPSEGFLTGVLMALAEARRDPAQVGRVLHGTTVATNMILEGRTARTALITTQGWTLLNIGSLLPVALTALALAWLVWHQSGWRAGAA